MVLLLIPNQFYAFIFLSLIVFVTIIIRYGSPA